MINMETVKFILMIDTLGELSKEGIKPISEIDETQEVEDCIYFDDSESIYNAMTHETYYKAVSVMFNGDEYNKEDNVYWDDYIETNTKYSVNVIVSDEGDSCVQVACGKQTFIIQDGECYSE